MNATDDNLLTSQLELPSAPPPMVSHASWWSPNRTIMENIVTALDDGPVKSSPQAAVALAVATPLLVLALCCFVMICRGVPSVPCGGRCTYWRRMPPPRGTEPDCGIGEHQDEQCDTDSVDEPSRAQAPVHDVELEEMEDMSRHAECCAGVASAFENGHDGSPSSRRA